MKLCSAKNIWKKIQRTRDYNRMPQITGLFFLFSATVYIAGIVAVIASVVLAILVALTVLQLAMASSAKRVLISYSTALISKVGLATAACEYKFLSVFPVGKIHVKTKYIFTTKWHIAVLRKIFSNCNLLIVDFYEKIVLIYTIFLYKIYFI